MDSEIPLSGANDKGNLESLEELQKQFVTVSEDLVDSGRYKVNIRADGYVHWSRSTLLSKATKSKWTPIANKVPSHLWKPGPEGRMGVKTVTENDVQRVGKLVKLGNWSTLQQESAASC